MTFFFIFGTQNLSTYISSFNDSMDVFDMYLFVLGHKYSHQFTLLKNLFGDASNELNVDLFDTQELKDLYDSVPGKVQGKVSFDCLFNIIL